MLLEAYGGNGLSREQCYRWFEKLQNGGFDVRNEERGRPAKNLKMLNCKHYSMKKMTKHKNISEQLNADQSSISGLLKAMIKIINVRRWVPYELTDRQQ
ncbi:hypothetical protein TNCV_4441021 [Trichonephila clavipes]|nr:hypothetical protein TNCV_4441021 [Trichonephila clavipes]